MRYNYSKKLLILIVSIFTMTLSAQDFEVLGKVVEKETNIPLAGATIIIKDTSTGVSSDFDGNFKITAKKGQILIVSYVGFKPISKDIYINKNETINFLLIEDVIFGDEVIISAIRAGDESPTTYTILDQAQIEKNNTGKDLPYIFNSTPSVVVSSDAGAGVGYTGMNLAVDLFNGVDVPEHKVTPTLALTVHNYANYYSFDKAGQTRQINFENVANIPTETKCTKYASDL